MNKPRTTDCTRTGMLPASFISDNSCYIPVLPVFADGRNNDV